MPNTHSPAPGTPRLGILGGGQLSQMLIQAAGPLGIACKAFCESKMEPAYNGSPNTYVGSLKNLDDLKKFSEQVDCLIFESEFVDVELLKTLQQSVYTEFLPPLSCLSLLRNKLKQKQILTKLKIPTAPYKEGPAIDQSHDTNVFLDWISECEKTFGDSFIIKWALYGYDGKGTHFYSRTNPKNAALDFILQAYQRGAQVYAEAKIKFNREVAIVCSTSKKQEIVFYPLVVSEQFQGICSRVYGPAIAFGLSAKMEEAAQNAARLLANETKLCGSFAIEFFETGEGLLVNEIAPRVHNSGHYSQDACVASQFENHLRGVCGLPIKNPEPKPFYAMFNLLGPQGLSYVRSETLLPSTLQSPNPQIFCHWYGKRDIKSGRKLGHLNAWAKDHKEFLEITRQLEVYQQNIYTFLKQESESKRSPNEEC